MLTLDKDFVYCSDTTSISCCDLKLIKEIVEHSDQVRDNMSLGNIRLAFLSIIMSLRNDNQRLHKLIYQINNLIKNKNEHSKIIDKHDEIDNLIHSISQSIIYDAIFIYTASMRSDTLSKYPRMLYQYIHDFKIMIYKLQLHYRYDWIDVFNNNESDIMYRLNMFAFRSCGLKDPPTFNPYVDQHDEYLRYMEDLKRDLEEFDA